MIKLRYTCTERALRQQMNDSEFWDYVFNRGNPTEWDFSGDIYDPIVDNINIANTCAECGSQGACGYDQEGRPMIHITNE